MKIGDHLARGYSSFSFEFFPPKSEEAAAQLERTIAELSVLNPTFVSVTYGAGGSTREKTLDIVSRVKTGTGIEAMAHLTCVGSTRAEIEGVLDRLVDAGVENVLALRGDPPKGQTEFVAVEGGFRYANDLVSMIRERYGKRLSVGGACYPERHTECANPHVDLTNLKRKVDAGLDFLVTQLFFDNRRYFEFVDRARAIGIRVPILPGLMPITNAAQVERFTQSCGAALPFQLAAELDRRRNDPQGVLQLGVAHATAQAIDLLMSGAPGLHFYTLNRSTATKDVFQALKAAGFTDRAEVTSAA
ncbi:methylenetetrahydrofolate reductase [NAD(P)H] [Nevskia soli]|jgi:methylenetetrahydrofolate reductase (NADPH)|uniref:methylenetetrahydrofolate reductase [NAD(P)H] n=1 Tax=Nevskia soli TaxID=418856 RepID=UPI0015D8D279|nr:methylenetetrahydrofolate reductase [NAD(P)H] [Nevskia soli]